MQRKPSITVTSLDLERIERLLDDADLVLPQHELLREELLRQKAQYQEVELSAETRLGQLGETPNPKGAMERAGAWIGVNMSTIADKTPSHMADMIIQGNTMGVVEVTRARNACPQADPIARDLADRLIGVSQQGIERAKGFL